MLDTVTPLPLCENCGRPAHFRWTLDSGAVSYACDRCRPAAGVIAENIESGDVASSGPVEGPVTVEQAAQRERVHPRTVYRWLRDGALGDGAWRTSEGKGEWRIDPAALDARRVSASRPGGRTTPRQKRQRPRSKPVRTDGMGWPDE